MEIIPAGALPKKPEALNKMKRKGFNKKILISTFLVLNLLSTQALALSAADVVSATGATVTDQANGDVKIATDAVDNLKAEVIFNKFSLHNQSLITEFNGLHQLLFIGDISGVKSQIRQGSAFSNATITASGIGKDTATLVLQNLKGFNFENGSVDIGGSLIVSTIENTTLTSSQALFRNKDNNSSNINIRNTDFNVPYGLSLVSAGEIIVKNSKLNASNGSVQLITSDGVNFKFKNNEILKATSVRDTQNHSGKIEVESSSLIAGAKKDIYINNQSKHNSHNSVLIKANTAIQAPDGSVYFIAENSATADKAKISYIQSNSNKTIDANKTIIKTTGEAYLNGTLKTANQLQINSNKVYLQHNNAHIIASGNLNLKTGHLQGKSDNTVESFGNLTLTTDEMDGTYRLNIKSGKNVKLTLNNQDLSLESYDQANNILNLRYDNKVQNALKVINPDNKTVNLNVSEDNTITVKNTIDKLSPLVLNAGHIKTANNATIANNRSVNITALKDDIIIDSYDSANDELNVNFGSDLLKIKNRKANVALATSENNSLTINDTINKNSNFTLKGGEILTSGAGVLDTSKSINITSYTQDIAINSYNDVSKTLNLHFGGDNLAVKNHRDTTLNASENNKISINNIIEKNRNFILSAGEFSVSDGAGLTTPQTVKITDLTGGLSLISNDTTGVKRFEDADNNFSFVNTDNLASKLDPDQLGTGKLEIITKNGDLDVYYTFDNAVSKLLANGKNFNVNEFNPAPLPIVVLALAQTTSPVQPEKFHIQPPSRGSGLLNNSNNINNPSPLANNFIPNNNTPNIFNFNEFGGASASMNNKGDSTKFVGVPCENDEINCFGQFKYYQVLEPILYN